jgi:hypothetical protein
MPERRGDNPVMKELSVLSRRALVLGLPLWAAG